MKNGPIFFKFSQELYYIMLKQNPVTVCPKSALSPYSKIKAMAACSTVLSKSRKP